jgi:hypothetical protein
VLSKNETFIPGSLLEVTVWAWDSAKQSLQESL